MNHRLRWRDYRTAIGARPVAGFIRSLTDEDAAAVADAMQDIAKNGLQAARHLRGEIYEARADGERRALRLLFAQETKFILLSLSGFIKKSRKTPPEEVARAEARLKDWRSRGGG